MMLKKSILVIVFTFLMTSCGMTSKAILYYKDGSRKTGIGKVTTDNFVKFKTEDSKKVERISFAELEKVKIYFGNTPTTYVREKVKGETATKVLEIVTEGKVNLYQIVSQGQSAPIMGANGMMMGGGMSYSISNYYVRKLTETEVTHLGSTSLFSKNFKKAASAYFSDCPDLIAKIQNRTFKKRHIEDIVRYYNTQCK